MIRILLPVAGVGVSVWAVIAIGGMIGLLSGLLGVGGGFLLTPILMMVGVPPTVAAASGTNAIVATSCSGVAAHFRLRHVDVRMGVILLVGGLAGSAIGVHIVRLLREWGNADLVITLTYILLLALVGGYIVRDSVRRMFTGQISIPKRRSPRAQTFLSRLPMQIDFPHSNVRHSLLLPFLLCFLVGILTAIMGVAGGFMLVPMMVYLLRMPAHVAIGTSLFQALFTCAGVTWMQAVSNHTVDVTLALLIALGSTVAAQVGARLSRYLRSEQLMILLGLLALGVMAKMLIGLVIAPSIPISEVAAVHSVQLDRNVALHVVQFGRHLMG